MSLKQGCSTIRDDEHVEYHQWKKADDSIPQNREEAMPMMQFFARRLRSQKGVPEGSLELS